jgi:tetratricopeptide (TPR) repeat protein
MYWQDASCYQGRLQIFKTKLFRWQGAVHENPMPRSRAFNESAMTDLEVLHLKPKERTQQSAEHYLQILLEKDPLNHFGLAESYKFLGQAEQSEEQYWLAFKHPEANDSTKYAALFNCALLNYELSDKEPERLDIAIKTCAVAISLLPERAECYSLLGMCNHVLNDKERAKECYKTALSKPEPSGAELVFHRFAKQVPAAGLQQLT